MVHIARFPASCYSGAYSGARGDLAKPQGFLALVLGLEGITERQDKIRRGQAPGVIDSTKKSEDRFDHVTRDIETLEDAHEQFKEVRPPEDR